MCSAVPVSRLSFIELDESNIGSHLHEIAVLKTAVNAEIAPTDPPVNLGWARAEMHLGTDIARRHHVVAVQGARVLGAARVVLALTGDGQHVADLHIEVHPSHRRGGIGTGLVASGVAIAQAAGCTSIAPWGPRTAAAEAFWTSLALPEVSVHQLSRLVVTDVDLAAVKLWHDQTAARQQGYTLHRWRGQCPDDLLPVYMAAAQAMHDAPADDLNLGRVPLDASWQRARESSYRQRGGLLRGMVAVAPNGEAGGMSEIALFKHRPWFVEQQGTATLAAHRNLGVARWLKATMFRELLRDHPEVVVIETGNAESNQTMISINQAMGFRPHRELTIRQASIIDVSDALRSRLSGSTIRPAVVQSNEHTQSN